MKQSIAIIGECMLELSGRDITTSEKALPMLMSYGGDTLNTSVYLARLGIEVEYLTALGKDQLSDWMLDQWRSEGVGCEWVKRVPNSTPGLYLIQIDESGERSFLYWRENSPARHMFDDINSARELFNHLKKSPLIALSGITLAIYSETARQNLFGLLAEYRVAGGRVVFDGNYRPGLWPSKEVARQAYEQIYQISDIALPTLEDEQQLFDEPDRDQVISRLRAWGVNEIALKMGENGCLVVADNSNELVAAREVDVVDTTAAGDSFNAGYIAARMNGKPAVEAAEQGHRLAAAVIQNKGAIIPAAAMPELLV